MDMVVHHDIGVEPVTPAIKMVKARSGEAALLFRKIGQPLREPLRHEVERSVDPGVGQPVPVQIENHDAGIIDPVFLLCQPKDLPSMRRHPDISEP